MIDINKEIAVAMKSKERDKLNVLKLIKTEFVKAEKNGVTIDDAKETSILLKMVEQRRDSIAQYEKGGRSDLADGEKKEIEIIEQYLPEQPSDEDIEKYTNEVIDIIYKQNDAEFKLSMRDMKMVLSVVQKKYPTANGKIVSTVLKNRIQ